MMHERTRALYAELAAALGLEALPADENGGVQLTVGGDSSVVLFGETAFNLMIVAPIAPLPQTPDYGTMLWLLGRNMYTSDLAPFRIACDEGGTLILWGRVPIEGMTGTALAGLVDTLGGEARRIREAVAEEVG